MIRASPEAFWASMSMRETHQNVVWSEADLNEYKTAYYNSETIHSVGNIIRLDSFFVSLTWRPSRLVKTIELLRLLTWSMTERTAPQDEN